MEPNRCERSSLSTGLSLVLQTDGAEGQMLSVFGNKWLWKVR